MKSTRKPFYNHRIAQSKEKWETDFLSKIEKANDLLYLAAVKSNGYTPLPKDDSYYTEENKPKILSTLEEVVSNPYNQRHHKNFADLKNQAIEILNQKTRSSPVTIIESPTKTDSYSEDYSKSNSNDSIYNNSINGDSEIGRTPKIQDPSFDPNADNFTSDARTILSQLDDIERISNDPEKFKRQWLDLEKTINNQLNIATRKNQINIKESSDIKARLENLSNKWVKLFYPGGFERLGNGTIIPLDVRDATADLLEQINTNSDSEQVTKLRDIFQKAFLDKKSTKSEELFGYLKELNFAISKRNGNKNIEGNVRLLEMSKYR
jgi:hypothetical protein